MFVFVYVCAWLAAVGDQRGKEESFLWLQGREKRKKKFAAKKNGGQCSASALSEEPLFLFFCCFSSSRLRSVNQFPTNPQNSDFGRASLPLPSSLLKCWSPDAKTKKKSFLEGKQMLSIYLFQAVKPRNWNVFQIFSICFPCSFGKIPI